LHFTARLSFPKRKKKKEKEKEKKRVKYLHVGATKFIVHCMLAISV
jgi:hypothetical protein